MRCALSVLLVWALGTTARASGSLEIRVLLFSGRNNHDWRATTPALAECLEKSRRFRVTILADTRTLTRDLLAEHDVVLSNFNTFVRRGAPEADSGWSRDAKDALIDFVRSGKGHVAVHAGSSSFCDWPEYQQVVIGNFKVGQTDHGRRHEFRVRISDRPHPITRGLEDFLTFDELWHGTRIEPDATVLAMAHSSKESGGSGRDEPIAAAGSFGAGRSFFLVLGHDVRAIENRGFQALLRRGTEWAATGRVDPEPKGSEPEAESARAIETRTPAGEETSSAAEGLRFDVREDSVALLAREEVIWRFRHRLDGGKPHFESLGLTGGPDLAWARPPDHPWHYGLWFSWKMVNGVNYWEEDPATQRGKGRTTVTKLRCEPREDHSARMEMEVSYHLEGDPPGRAVLTERRTIEVSSPREDGAYHIDWTSEHTSAGGAVLLERTPLPGEPGGQLHGGYAGLSFRMRNLENRVACSSDGPTEFGRDERFRGRATAFDYSGRIAGQVVGAVILDHPANLDSPSPWYAIRSRDMTFFSPAVICFKPYTIGAGESLVLRYRIILHRGRLDAHGLRSAYESFVEATRSSDREGHSLRLKCPSPTRASGPALARG